MRIILFCLFSILMISSLGCSNSSQAKEPELTIFAAAQLQDAFTELKDNFEEKMGVKVIISFAGAQVVRAQIEQGAPADVFASSDISHMNALQEQQLVGEALSFSNNTLTIMLPISNPSNIVSIEDLATKEYRLVIGVEDVPIGMFTRQFLERANEKYGSNFKETVLANTASLETNTRQVSGKITMGEGDIGITYVTDVIPSIKDKVMTIDIPDELNIISENTIAITTNAQQPELAQQWIDYVLSEEGQEILAHHQFIKVK
ncbi:molybdate ABC transporter substrate-binding protein [Anaerobacillus sp. MEB173]|uniref:molybdate ABC transporter substrate-binding protein n=1 Tax=Anaerobacillus sp. MEB173 TaxID=3383345 RepID=UPI003F93E5AA